MAWVKNPVPLTKLGDLPEFQCSSNLIPNDCPVSTNCEYKAPLPVDRQQIFMNVCGTECPDNYPYLNNVDGEDKYTTVAPTPEP